MPNLEELTKSALELNNDERALLADRLIASLDDVISGEEWNRAWGEEAKRRLNVYLAGNAETYTHEEVCAYARRHLA